VTAAVEVTGLAVRFGSVEAVRGLTMTAPAGQVTAVLGPNGAGKTTAVETCEGYRRSFGGSVRVLGLDPVAGHRSLRQRVGVMLQAGGVPGGASAASVLAYTAGLYANPLEVGALTERLGIDGYRRTPFRRLSGGQQQQVKLALALVGRPELVFLDEPTSGLDPAARDDVLDLLRELRGDGVTVVMTSHLLAEAEAVADHVVIIDAGRAVAEGSPAELVAAAVATEPGQSAASVRFSAPGGLGLAELLAELPAGSTAAEETNGHYRVVCPGSAVSPAVLAAVTGWCAARDVMPEDLVVGAGPAPTLEDVYRKLTRRSAP
jgi:ABC-2 type transport system ATP-binding protein